MLAAEANTGHVSFACVESLRFSTVLYNHQLLRNSHTNKALRAVIRLRSALVRRARLITHPVISIQSEVHLFLKKRQGTTDQRAFRAVLIAVCWACFGQLLYYHPLDRGGRMTIPTMSSDRRHIQKLQDTCVSTIHNGPTSPSRA